MAKLPKRWNQIGVWDSETRGKSARKCLPEPEKWLRERGKGGQQPLRSARQRLLSTPPRQLNLRPSLLNERQWQLKQRERLLSTRPRLLKVWEPLQSARRGGRQLRLPLRSARSQRGTFMEEDGRGWLPVVRACFSGASRLRCPHTMRYVMKEKLFAWGDDFTIRNEAGKGVFFAPRPVEKRS